MSLFDVLPTDIKQYVLRPLLDDLSLFILRMALWNPTPHKQEFTEAIQKDIIASGLKLTDRFNKNLSQGSLAIFASEVGSLEVLKHLYKNNHISIFVMPNLLVSKAAENGHLHILKFLVKNTIGEVNKDTCKIAVNNGHLHIFKYLDKIKVPYANFLLQKAAKSGNLELFRYLYEEKGLRDSRACTHAIEHNHFSILKYCVEQHITRYPNVRTTVIHGRIEMLKYIMEKGYFKDEHLDAYLSNAAYYGHLNIVKFLCEEFPSSMTADSYKYAIKKDYPDIVKYLQKKECPRPSLIELEKMRDNLSPEMIEILEM